MACSGFSGVLSTFEKSVENYEAISDVGDSQSLDGFKSVAKLISDSLHKTSNNGGVSYQNVPFLVIENFDDEQVWQQLELKNAPITTHRRKYLKTFDSCAIGVKTFRGEECHDKIADIDLSSEEECDYLFDGSDSDDNSEQQNSQKCSETGSQKTLKEHKRFKSSSVVDDKFFKISQLEEFLKYSDLKEERGQSEVCSDESDINLFADIPSDDEAIDGVDEEVTKNQKKSSREIMYKDFFDPPEDEESEPNTNEKSDILCSTEEFLNRVVDSQSQDLFKSVKKTFNDSLQKTSKYGDISYENVPPLILENVDDEQVWQQLELRNAPVTAHRPKSFDSSVLGKKTFRGQECHDSEITDNDLSSEQDCDSLNDGSDNDDDSEQQNSHKNSETAIQKNQKVHKRFNSSSMVDDKFFQISQLEEFLKYSDLKEERGQNEVGSDESDINLFADIPSDNDGDEGAAEKRKKTSRDIMYKDFFDPPEDERNEPDTNQKSDIHCSTEEFLNRKHSDAGKKKTVRFSQDVQNDKKLQLLEDSDGDSILNENSEHEKRNVITGLERQQEKECKQVQRLQQSLLQPKPWQFTGEIAGDSRPQDSLLRQNTEFDSNLKPDFVSTDEITERVESIIKKTVENKAWSDVEVKVRPVEDVFKYKYTEPLNQAKSQKSLAEIYEDEYKKKHENEGEKEDPRHIEIKKLMASVESTLSNLFGHTPRPPVPEVKVVNNMPSITLEEVAPVGVSDAALLAPEEIKSKSGLPIGKSERTDTDKKRERRKKKKLQKIRKLEQEERERKKATVSKKAASKFAKQQALKKLSQQKNVTIVHDKKHKQKS